MTKPVAYYVHINEYGYSSSSPESRVALWCRECAVPCDPDIGVPDHDIAVGAHQLPLGSRCAACGKELSLAEREYDPQEEVDLDMASEEIWE